MASFAKLSKVLCACFRFRPRLRDYPTILFHIHPFAIDGDAFRFKQAPLKACVRLSNQQESSGADHAMPRNSFASWTGCHSVPSRPRAATQPERLRQRAIGRYAAARNFPHQLVNRIPSRHSIPLSGLRRSDPSRSARFRSSADEVELLGNFPNK
jgi:hypothetical protein